MVVEATMLIVEDNEQHAIPKLFITPQGGVPGVF